MRKYLFITFICLCSMVVKSQENVTVYRFTLEECINYALKNNYNHQSMQLSETAKEDAYKQSKLDRVPSLNASLGESLSSSKDFSPSWGGNYIVSAGVTLYQGGNLNKTIEQNKLQVGRASFQTSQYENELTIQILQAFLTVLGNEELLKYQEMVVRTSEEQFKQGEVQLRVGNILESDYLMLEAQYVNDKNNITDTKIVRDNNLLKLKSLLSIHPTEELRVIYPDTTAFVAMSVLPSLHDVTEKAMNSLPDLKISQYNIDIARTGVQLARSGYFPTLSMSGSVGTGHSVNYSNFGTQLSDQLKEQMGLSLSIPIFNGRRVKSNVTQSKIALEQAELEKRQTEIDVMQQVIQEYQDVVSAYNLYRTTNIKQYAYLKTYETYHAQFNAGAITTVDLLQQQNNYIGVLNDYIQSKYGFMLKRKILDIYIGEPVRL